MEVVDTTTWIALALVAALNAALGCKWLLRESEEPISMGRVVWTASACAALLALQCLAVALNGSGLFLWVQLGYLMSIVAVPVCGAVLLAQRRRRAVTPTASLCAAAAVFVVLPVGLYATFVEPGRLQLERASIPVDAARALDRPLRIGVLADIQARRVTQHERDAVARIMAEAPDLILLPGDLIQVRDAQTFHAVVGEFRALLAELHAPLGVYFVLGDCDRASGIELAIEGTQVRLLENEVVRVRHGERDVEIAGVELDFTSPVASARLHEFETAPGDALRILCAHRPDVVYALGSPSRVDLVVAGHTHGGQVVVPGFGPLVTLSNVPRAAAAGGYHELDGRRLYVSRGVGVERGHAPPIRLFCPPEVSLLTLEPAAGPE